MKKYLLTMLLSLIYLFAFSGNYYPVKITKIDGSELVGLAQLPKNSGAKLILYKQTKDSKTTKLTSLELKRLIYTFKDATTAEFEQIKPISFNNKFEKKTWPAAWLELYYKDAVSIYLGFRDGYTVYSTSGSRSWPSDTFYYLKNNDEDGATLIHQEMSGFQVGKNSMFKAFGPIYFGDNTDIAEKIKNEEYTYSNLVDVVKIYSNWIQKK
jgi:hypothetical protein